MSAPYCFLNFKLEDTLANWLSSFDTELPGLATIYKTADVLDADDGIKLPNIQIIVANGRPFATEIDAQSKQCVRTISVGIQIVSYAEDGLVKCRESHGKLVGKVFDGLYSPDIVEQLNMYSVDGIKIMQLDLPIDSTIPVERSYQTTLLFDVMCRPKL